MFRTAILFCCLVCTILGSGNALAQAATQKQTVMLDSGWEFHQLTDSPGGLGTSWHPAQVPGDVHLDLLHNNLIPDPFYRDNEAKLQWIEDASWEYRTTIQAAPAVLDHKNIELVLDRKSTRLNSSHMSISY